MCTASLTGLPQGFATARSPTGLSGRDLLFVFSVSSVSSVSSVVSVRALAASGMHFEVRILTQGAQGHERPPIAEREADFGAPVVSSLPARWR